jgi:hypothetical protein
LRSSSASARKKSRLLWDLSLKRADAAGEEAEAVPQVANPEVPKGAVVRRVARRVSDVTKAAVQLVGPVGPVRPRGLIVPTVEDHAHEIVQ